MKKIKIQDNIFVNPMPVVLIGSSSQRKDNFMNCAWISQVNVAPAIVSISINKNHKTAISIKETQCFSINIPTEELMEKTDYSGMVSNRRISKKELFDVFYSEEFKVPMIKECAVNIECKVVDIKEFQTNTVFFGKFINCYSEKKYLTNNKLDNNKINGFSVIMPDNIYISKGKKIGNALDENTMKKFSLLY
ncbi:MAG: flavin reductase family protein [Candidatus Muirbacterium halophilum]|nr:flavin reductase family protein [Candidatus Muirbacterium halophilum]MCK9476457.1 flavin reductase family protein [Candidatus Muirbacterium halophilum]